METPRSEAPISNDPLTDSPADHGGDEWVQFLDATAVREPRDMLLRALQVIGAEAPPPASLRGVDLGCGSGHEVVAMLRSGHFRHVIGVDFHPEAVRRTGELAREHGVADRLTTMVSPLERFALAPGSADLIHAGFTLPFVDRSYFSAVWEGIRRALAAGPEVADCGSLSRKGGLFAGQLFGVNDTWATSPRRHHRDAVFMERAAVDRLIAEGGWEVLHLEEVDREGRTAVGETKHWHVFHLLLRAPARSE